MTLPVRYERTALQKYEAQAADFVTPLPGVPSLPDVDYSRPMRRGLWVLAVGFFGFLLWAAFAPLDEGVPAPGTISVESKRKRVDHLNGGIVEKILVREGQHVREGEELVLLNEAQAKAALRALQSQWRTALATEARLNAERLGLARIVFPAELADHPDQETASILRAQSELFASRRAAVEGELRIIRESVRGLQAQLRSLDQLQAGREKQVALFGEQLASFRGLNKQGFVSRNQLLDMERQLSEIQSKQSEDMANIAGVNARLADYRMRGSQREIEYRREVETQLAEVQREVATLTERVEAQRDLHSRLSIRAPVSGTVVDVAFHTVGGVIKPGERIVDIVPDGDDLVVEARVPTQYIDRVRAGLPADVHFDAYLNRVDRAVISGTVAVVSADALADAKQPGQSYYALRVTVPAAELSRLAPLKLQPGMQGTVMIKTGERSLLVYLTRPLLRRFRAAMTES
jgi:membrane fusion protein, protease secretion system